MAGLGVFQDLVSGPHKRIWAVFSMYRVNKRQKRRGAADFQIGALSGV